MTDPARGGELDDPLDPETISAVFSSTARRGEWLPAEDTRVRALFGNVTLDLTQALLAPGVTVLDTLALFGSVEIVVPAGLEVELAASAVLGSVEQRDAGGGVRRFLTDQIRRVTGQGPESPYSADAEEDAAVLRIEGHAVFGSITVKVR